MEFSEELIAKAKACKNEEEVKTLAKENEIELTDYEIKLILAENAEGELADNELEAVSGGRACNRNEYEDKYYSSEDKVEFIFNIGDVVQAFIGIKFGSATATVKITDRKKDQHPFGWIDVYKYDRISGAPTNIGFGWQCRSRFEK